MLSVLPSVLPIWGLVIAGWFARRLGVFGASAVAPLNGFVFSFAAPALLMCTLAKAPLSAVLNRGVLGFLLSGIVAGALGFAVARWGFGCRGGEQVLVALSGCYINSTNLGLPVVTQVLGRSDFIVAAALVQILVVTPVVLLLVEMLTSRRAGLDMGRVLTAPIRNPIVVASAFGVLVSVSGWQVPPMLFEPVRLLGQAAVPTGLFVLGMALYRVPGTARETPAGRLAVLVTLKLVVQPMAALAIGLWLIPMPLPTLAALVLCAGLPTAQNVFVFARQFGLAAPLARDMVFVSTVLAMPTMVIISGSFAGVG